MAPFRKGHRNFCPHLLSGRLVYSAAYRTQSASLHVLTATVVDIGSPLHHAKVEQDLLGAPQQLHGDDGAAPA